MRPSQQDRGMETGTKAGEEHRTADRRTEIRTEVKQQWSADWSSDRRPGPSKGSTAHRHWGSHGVTVRITTKTTTDLGSASPPLTSATFEYVQDGRAASSSPEDTGQLTPPQVFKIQHLGKTFKKMFSCTKKLLGEIFDGKAFFELKFINQGRITLDLFSLFVVFVHLQITLNSSSHYASSFYPPLLFESFWLFKHAPTSKPLRLPINVKSMQKR